MESNSRKVSLQVWEWRFCNSKNPIPEIGISNHNIFFPYSPFYPHFYIYYSYVPLFFFLMQILILFIFTSITIHQSRERERERERELRKENVGLVLAGMGDDDGFQNYCLVVIVEYANLVIATGNGGFRRQFGTVYMWRSNSIQVQGSPIFDFLIFNI